MTIREDRLEKAISHNVKEFNLELNRGLAINPLDKTYFIEKHRINHNILKSSIEDINNTVKKITSGEAIKRIVDQLESKQKLNTRMEEEGCLCPDLFSNNNQVEMKHLCSSRVRSITNILDVMSFIEAMRCEIDCINLNLKKSYDLIVKRRIGPIHTFIIEKWPTIRTLALIVHAGTHKELETPKITIDSLNSSCLN